MSGIKLSKLSDQYNASYFELVGHLNSFGAGIDESSVSPDFIVSDAYLPYLSRVYENNSPKRRIADWDELNSAFKERRIVKGYVRSKVKGGFVVEVCGITAFCPGSQMDTKRIESYDSYVDNVFDFRIMDVDEAEQNVIVSRKLAKLRGSDDFSSNLSEKESLLNELEDLVGRPFDKKSSFPEFRDIQDRWLKIGPVPQASFREINDKYQRLVTKFHDMAKLFREKQDLELKKNYESKVSLCEEAESLAKNEQLDVAYLKLQKLHKRWKEIGPVPKEYNDSIWERFQAATRIINQKKAKATKNEDELRPAPANAISSGTGLAVAGEAKSEPIPDGFFTPKMLELLQKDGK